MSRTVVLSANLSHDVERAIAMLSQGECVAVPTETVYGLAANARCSKAVEKIFIAKERPDTHPLIVHIASVDELSQWASHIPDIAYKLADAFWPGPLTLVLKRQPGVSDKVTGGLETIAIRVPQHPVFLNVLSKVKTGLAAPSANKHKSISPTKAEHVMQTLSGKIAAVLDAGPSHIGIESTILDLTENGPRILRHGPITALMIEAIIQQPVFAPEQHDEKIAGNMRDHYQPKTRMRVLTRSHIEVTLSSLSNQPKQYAVIHHSRLDRRRYFFYSKSMSGNTESYASSLYSALHEADKLAVDEILVEAVPNTLEWAAVRDRLSKAAAKVLDIR